MSEIVIAKIIRKGEEQSVRIPPQFHFQGNRLHIRVLRGAILLEPIFKNTENWFSSLDRCEMSFMKNRNQPPLPHKEIFS